MTLGPRGVGPFVVRVLLVCGSLQRRSANRAALDVVRAIALEHSAIVEEFEALADIPAFDFTRQDEPIAAVAEWRRRVAEADVVVLAAPEYAGGLAGAAKNALDWLVGSGDLYRKPVAVVSAGTSGGVHARRQLVQTLTWQGAYVVAELGISAPRTKSDQRGEIADPETLDAIAALAAAALEAPELEGAELAHVASGVVVSLGVDVTHVAPPAA